MKHSFLAMLLLVASCGSKKSDLTLTITNKGTGALVVTSMTSDNPQFTAIGSSPTVAAGASASVTVRFTPTRNGEYPFHCDVDGHAKKGMTGTLVVRD